MKDFFIRNGGLFCIILTFVSTLSASSAYWHERVTELKRDCGRLRNNQIVLTDSITTLYTRTGRQMATIEQLALAKNELLKICEEQEQDIKDMGIKCKNLQHLITAGSTTTIRIDTLYRDSIVYRTGDTIPDTIRTWIWQDPWITAEGQEGKDGHMQVNLSSRDTLTVALHREPKRFLFFRFGTRRVLMSISSHNPHTSYTYARYVKIE